MAYGEMYDNTRGSLLMALGTPTVYATEPCVVMLLVYADPQDVLYTGEDLMTIRYINMTAFSGHAGVEQYVKVEP